MRRKKRAKKEKRIVPLGTDQQRKPSEEATGRIRTSPGMTVRAGAAYADGAAGVATSIAINYDFVELCSLHRQPTSLVSARLTNQ